MSQAQLIQQHLDKIKARVADLTRYSADELNAMFFEDAYKFLDVIQCTGRNATLMSSTPQFWNFWRKQWSEIDESFLKNYHALCPDSTDYSAIGMIECPETGALHTVKDYRALRMWYAAYHECSLSNRCLNSTLIKSTFTRNALIRTNK